MHSFETPVKKLTADLHGAGFFPSLLSHWNCVLHCRVSLEAFVCARWDSRRQQNVSDSLP